jgi:hypothetical protein
VTLQVRLLGHPRIEGGTRQPCQPPRGQKSWALLARVALAERPLTRGELAAELFGEAHDPLGALRWSLADLRRCSQDPQLFRGDPVSLAGSSLWIDPAHQTRGARGYPPARRRTRREHSDMYGPAAGPGGCPPRWRHPAPHAQRSAPGSHRSRTLTRGPGRPAGPGPPRPPRRYIYIHTKLIVQFDQGGTAVSIAAARAMSGRPTPPLTGRRGSRATVRR